MSFHSLLLLKANVLIGTEISFGRPVWFYILPLICLVQMFVHRLPSNAAEHSMADHTGESPAFHGKAKLFEVRPFPPLCDLIHADH